jgi:EAL domain-containing protein (putative c-di-GMP-specific phosphodiesterase class I)
LAEEAQLMHRLGSWILDTACADLKTLSEIGCTSIVISVNVSALQFESAGFVDDVARIMDRHQVAPNNIEIEVTEQIALSSSQGIAERLKALRQLGVRLAMDDFGMGHSSLLYLKEFHFDTVKLDGSLVREILSNPTCCNIIRSIVSLGESLKYSVIAEYVETEEQKLLLHELGCDRYQGYLFSPALPLPQLKQLIGTWQQPLHR